MDEPERNKVFDYFCFEIYNSEADGEISMSGYPALINNGEKLAQIENPQTREIIKQLKPYVQRFTQENKVRPDGRFISADMAKELNNILSVMPELQTIIGKEQHGTHDYSVDVHTLAVLQECVKNPKFQNLKKEEKQTLMLSALLHDITKEERAIDKSHPKTGAYDAFFILKKLNLPNSQQDNFNVIIHGFDTEMQQSVLDALVLPNQNALLSTSYVVYDKGNYHAFRQQGFIKNIADDNIGVAYFRDFGSGYKKDTKSLVNNYINGFLSSFICRSIDLKSESYYIKHFLSPFNLSLQSLKQGFKSL